MKNTLYDNDYYPWVHFSQIILEALTDALDYKGWTVKSQFAGMMKHDTQNAMNTVVFCFGYWYGHYFDLTSYKTIGLIACYLSVRFLFFDIFYSNFSSQIGKGTTSLYDKIMDKLKINNSSIPVVIFKFILIFASTILMDKL